MGILLQIQDLKISITVISAILAKAEAEEY